MSYSFKTIYEVYQIGGGGQGYYAGHVGFFSSFEEAEKVHHFDAYTAINNC